MTDPPAGGVTHPDALTSVEISYARPPAQPAFLDRQLAQDPPPPTATPDFQGQQGYLNPAPEGIDAVYAWTQAGRTGLGINLVDIEGAWRTTHEDMPVLFHARGTQINDLGWRNHGTAALGAITGKNNGSA